MSVFNGGNRWVFFLSTTDESFMPITGETIYDDKLCDVLRQ